MKEISVTITVGLGSEQHNHDVEYRKTLEHVDSEKGKVIELIEYRPYRNQVNEALSPYINEYNNKVLARYKAAWDRYNAGEIKTKPRRRDYQQEDPDYFTAHAHDKYFNRNTKTQEDIPMYRSIIIGLGDQKDREKGNLTEEQAQKIFGVVVEKFRADFPNFLLLGATMHTDEKGFYHIHIDYKPLYDRDIGQGLNVGVGLDSALERMGYQPEQSIMNGRDKAPLLFNAMRNQIYRRVEAAMAIEGLRMQYNATQKKDPGKDSSTNQRLGNWQATQDAVREIQHSKNVALDILERDEVTPEEVKTAITAIEDMSSKLEEIKQSPRSRLAKEKVVVVFNLLDQLGSFVQSIYSFFAAIIKERDKWRDECLNHRYNASRGRYMNEFDVEILKISARAEAESEKAQIAERLDRLEQHLIERGISPKTIERIEVTEREKDFQDPFEK